MDSIHVLAIEPGCSDLEFLDTYELPGQPFYDIKEAKRAV